MRLKSLLIAMSFAVCIDRSFEDFQVINCNSPQDCYNKVIEFKLNEGVVPILMSYEHGNIKVEPKILEFIKNYGFTKILKVNSVEGMNNDLAKHLHRIKSLTKNIDYPIVTAMNDNRVIRYYAKGFDINNLTTVLEAAKNPYGKDFVSRSHQTFTSDLEKMIGKFEAQGQNEMAGTLEESPKQPELDLTLDFLGYRKKENLQLDLNEFPDLLPDSNPDVNRKRSRSPSTPGQTGPSSKKGKEKVT